MDVSSPHWSRPRVRTPHRCLVTFLRSPPWNGLGVTGGASWPHSPPCVAQPRQRSHPWPLSSTFTSCYLPRVTRLGSRPGSVGEQCSPVRWRTEAWITPYRWTGLPRICMPSLVVWLDCLAGTTCSIFCLRQCEGAAAQICNVWWNFDPLAGYAQFEGGMAPVCQPARMIRLGKAVISVRVTLKNQLSTSSGSCTITGIVWSCSSNRPAPRGPGLMLGVQSAH